MSAEQVKALQDAHHYGLLYGALEGLWFCVDEAMRTTIDALLAKVPKP